MYVPVFEADLFSYVCYVHGFAVCMCALSGHASFSVLEWLSDRVDLRINEAQYLVRLRSKDGVSEAAEGAETDGLCGFAGWLFLASFFFILGSSFGAVIDSHPRRHHSYFVE